MKGKLVLENGDSFTGTLISSGSTGPVEGEVVFFTGMTGYQEVLTDPSFKGQIVVFTYPLIGNYGINKDDFESACPQVSAVIICESSPLGHHYKADHSLEEYLTKWHIPLLKEADTRAIVKRIRNHGMMNGAVAQAGNELEKQGTFQAIEEKKLVPTVSVTHAVTYGSGNQHVVLMDFGFKKSILDSLLQLNCTVTIVPYDTTYASINALGPDGVILSNGPGDPKQLSDHLTDIKRISETYPVLGICLGHQLLALAYGADTKKLKFGHRGANQPVKDLIHHHVFMTSQNHSYVVDEASLQSTGFSVRFRNVNDGSVEGIMHPSLPVHSVQFHPEAHPGPSDSAWIIEDFVESLKAARSVKTYA